MEPNFWQKNLTVLEGPKSLKIVQERFLWFWQKSYSLVYKITNETSNFLQTPHACEPHALHLFLELWSQNFLTNQEARFNQNPKVMPNSGSALSKEWVAIWNWFFACCEASIKVTNLYNHFKWVCLGMPKAVDAWRHVLLHTYMPAYVIPCAHTITCTSGFSIM